jgi:hypothetical protein
MPQIGAHWPRFRPLGTRGSRGGRREPALALREVHAYAAMTPHGLPPFATIALVAVLGMACAPSAPLSSSSGSAPGSPVAQASAPAATACTPIDLRLPSGEALDLTGTWQGARSVTFVRQVGSCVSWISLSDPPGQELGASQMVIFRGELASDFTLSGEWSWIVGIDHPPVGSVTFEIDQATVNGEETLVLRSTTPAAMSEGGGPYGAATLEYAGPLHGGP